MHRYVEEPDEFSSESDGDDFKVRRKKRAAKKRKAETVSNRNARKNKLKRVVTRQKEYLAHHGLVHRVTDAAAEDEEGFMLGNDAGGDGAEQAQEGVEADGGGAQGAPP
jgi:hypothetical protein